MTYSKAYKDVLEIQQSPEYVEYMEVMLVYKMERKRWLKVKKALDPDSEDIRERLQYFDAQQRHSKACSKFQIAKNKYESWRIKRTLKGISDKDLMKMIGERIPLSLEDMVKEAQTAQNVAEMTDEQFNQIKNTALKHMNEQQTTQQRFMPPASSGMKDDPTLDDSPLPE